MNYTLFVGNLGLEIGRAELERFCAQGGKVASVRLPVDRATGKLKGFAFVDFQSEGDAERALALLNGRSLGGRRLRLGWARASQSTDERRPDGRHADLRQGGLGGNGNRWSAAPAVDEEEDDDRPYFYDPDPGREASLRRRRGGKHGSDRRRHGGRKRYLE